MQKTKFSPTPTQVRAAFDVFRSMAWEATIRPIVEGYQRKILADLNSAPEIDYREDKTAPKIVLEPKHAWLLPKKTFMVYHVRCNEEQEKAGLITDHPDHCPLLVAEGCVTKAEHAIVEAMQCVTGLTSDELLCAGMDRYRQYIDLTLRLLAPFVPDDIDANVNVN